MAVWPVAAVFPSRVDHVAAGSQRQVYVSASLPAISNSRAAHTGRNANTSAGASSSSGSCPRSAIQPPARLSTQPHSAHVMTAWEPRGARRSPASSGFPARVPAKHDGDYLKLSTLSHKHWTPGLRAAGIEHRGVYACRHTFAAWSIAAGVQLFYLSRIMGTSVTQIDATYGHLVPTRRSTCVGCSTLTIMGKSRKLPATGDDRARASAAIPGRSCS